MTEMQRDHYGLRTKFLTGRDVFVRVSGAPRTPEGTEQWMLSEKINESRAFGKVSCCLQNEYFNGHILLMSHLEDEVDCYTMPPLQKIISFRHQKEGKDLRSVSKEEENAVNGLLQQTERLGSR